MEVFGLWGLSLPRHWFPGLKCCTLHKNQMDEMQAVQCTSVLLSSPASILSFSPSCVCVSRGSRPTSDPELMRAITRIKRGWLQGVRVWGLNNYTLLPTCFSSWLRKLQSRPVPPPPHTLSVSIQKKGLMENNKLSRGHVNLDVNRQAIMF